MNGMSKRGRLARLNRLRREIERALGAYPSTWFWYTGREQAKGRGWPRSKGVNVQGFKGTGHAMLVAYMPSAKPSRKRKVHPANDFLYRTLAKSGLGRAHLTDLFHQRSSVDDKALVVNNPRTAAQARRWFIRESRIVRPRVVMTFGKEVTEVLRGWGLITGATNSRRDAFVFRVPGGRRVPVIETVHPSAAMRWGNGLKARFRKDCAKVRRLYHPRRRVRS